MLFQILLLNKITPIIATSSSTERLQRQQVLREQQFAERSRFPSSMGADKFRQAVPSELISQNCHDGAGGNQSGDQVDF